MEDVETVLRARDLWMETAALSTDMYENLFEGFEGLN